MKIGYAMYSARELCHDADSLKEVLHKIADMGYDGVEMFLYNGMPAEELEAVLKECGLEAIGTHVHKPRWDADTQGEISYAVKAQIPYLVYPWIDPELRTEEFYRKLPEYLRELAKRCGEHGVKLQYHNHAFEFEKLGQKTVMDYLLEAEESFDFELDTFWAHYAGVNVIEYMEKLGDRVKMIHIKDYLKVEDGKPSCCAIGTGNMDNIEIIRYAREKGKEWLIVELDNSPLNPLESARISIDYIKKVL